MPEPPAKGLVNQYILEDPLLMTGLLAAVALVIGIIALRDGRRNGQIAAGVLLGLAGLVFALGMLVTTPGEHAEATVRDFTAAIEANDADAAIAKLSPDAAIRLGTPNNPPSGPFTARQRVESFMSTYSVKSHTNTRVDGYPSPDQDDVGRVYLGCITSVETGLGYGTPTTWIVDVEKASSGDWKITSLAWITMATKPVSGGLIP